MLQGCCLTGAWSPEAPTICSQGAKILNEEPAQMPETYDADGNNIYAYFHWTNKRIPTHFVLLKRKRKTCVHQL